MFKAQRQIVPDELPDAAGRVELLSLAIEKLTTAISHVGDSYSQNFRNLADWEIAVDKGHLPTWRGLELSDDDIIRADVIQQIMCGGDIDRRRVEDRYDLQFDEYFADAPARLLEPGAGVGSLVAAVLRRLPRRKVTVTCYD